MNERVQREGLIAASPEDVWDAVTGAGWLADDVYLELQPGGEAYFRCADEIKTGWVEEARAPAPGADEARLAFWWASDGQTATRVELTIRRHEAGTLLRVVEGRPLDVLDLVGTPLPGVGGRSFGPALVAA